MTPELQPLGRTLLLLGAIFAGIGTILLLTPKIPWLGRLPGDFYIQRDSFSFYFPLTSCLLASAIISLVFWILGRFRP